MARAGDAVARLALALAPHARRIARLRRPRQQRRRRHRGGDAPARARQGRRRCSASAPSALPADAAQALARASDAGVEIGAFHADDAPPTGDRPDLVIDALLGIGASRPPEGEIAAAIARIAELAALGARVLAVDVPSGLDVDRGQPLGAACVVADDTLTLLTLEARPLHRRGPRSRRPASGCDPLGVDADDAPSPTPGSSAAAILRAPPCRAATPQHKGSFGDVAVVGGAPGMAGAAWLAARAAHAAGAGRVFVDLLGDGDGRTKPAARSIRVRPELMFRRGWWRGGARVARATTVVCGCGGGDAVRALLPRLLSLAPRLVLDADALNAIAADPSLQTLLRRAPAAASRRS